MTGTVNYSIDLTKNEKQKAFFNEVFSSTITRKYKYFSYGGAIRGGKTFVTLAILIALCRMFRGSRWVVVRKAMPALEKTTIPSIEKLLRGSPNAKWTRKAGNCHVEILGTGGSKIFFQPENIDNDPELNAFLGLECNGFFLEQIEELSEKLWDRCVERSGSWYIDQMPPPFIFTTFNPTQKWPKAKFYDKYIRGELEPPFFFMHALPDDNPFVTNDQWDAWKTLDPLNYDRFIKGDWSAFAVDKPFFYSFKEDKHVGSCSYDDSEYLRLSFDFNVDPITCIASQYVDGQIRIIKEFRLQNSDIFEMCERINASYPTASFLVTGDASGHNRSALSKGNINYYTVIKKELRLTDQQLKQPSVNPSVKDTRVLSNSILENCDFVVDSSCTYTIADMKYVEVNKDGDIDKTRDKHMSHFTDTVRYLFNTFHSNLLKIDLAELSSE